MRTLDRTATMKQEITVDQIGEFFSTLQSKIKEDKTAMLCGIASEEKTEFYEGLIGNDPAQTLKTLKSIKDQATVQSMMVLFQGYMDELSKIERQPKRIAFWIEAQTIYVWAEVVDYDEKLSKDLMLTELKATSKYHEQGLDISTCIVEESENASIPKGYQMLPEAK